MAEQLKFDVFISYRRDGGEVMGRLLFEMLKDNYNVFFDHESLSSGRFDKKILEVIAGCTDVLFVLSKGCLERCCNEDDWFLKEISCLDGVYKNGEGEEALPSVLNLRFAGVRNEDFLYNMDLKGICVAAGSACASASVKPSHVLTAMGLTENEARESVRFSFGKDNTEEEVLLASKAFKDAVCSLRNF